ncbi:MAG: hypothetical protein JWM53_3897 [bacterium]|nr:hypothetical protein [bacterium]
MRWTLGVAAAAALVVAAGGCGSTITVPDQGLIVTGCQQPAQCYRNDCSCVRSDVELGQCTVPADCGDMGDPSMCNCPMGVVSDTDLGTHFDSVCIEMAQACVGRGVFCGGAAARCKPKGSTCDGTGDLPMMIPTIGIPMLEPHCQYVDDVCCSSDGGIASD